MPSNKYKSGISSSALKPLAAVIYAAAANQDARMMQYVGSTVLNRLESGRKEFGAERGSINDVIRHKNAYYEKNSQLYDDFMTGNFKDEASKMAAKRAMFIASGLNRGTVERLPGHFWFNDDEEQRLRKTPKAFDFKQVKNLGKVGKQGQFTMYGY